jgi:hypothetical protein
MEHEQPPSGGPPPPAQPTKEDLALAAQKTAYKKALGSGTKASNQRPPASPEELEKRRINFEQNYKLTVEDIPGHLGSTFAAHGFTDPAYLAIARHKDASTGYLYDWYISLGSGVLVTRDVQKAQVETLYLSDILFQLIQAAIRKHQETPNTQPLPPFRVTKILHYNVAAKDTVLVVKECLRLAPGALPVTFRYPSDQFLALLGTGNLNSAAYLLHDYGQFLGIGGISDISILNVTSPDGGETQGLALTFQ